MHRMNSAVTALLVAAMLMASLPARGSIVGTEQMVIQQTRAASLDRIETVLASEEVASRLQAFGVAPEAVQQRIAALTDTEIEQLVATIDSAPAGGDALAVIGIVFVVLVILELVGVTNIFRRI